MTITKKRKSQLDSAREKAIKVNTGRVLSLETKEKMRNHMLKNHPTARACKIGRRKFKSISDAGLFLGMTPSSVKRRIESKGFENHKFI